MSKRNPKPTPSEAPKPSWYSVTLKADDEAEVMIYDAIGMFGVSASQFVRDLKGIKAKTLNVRINSPGGEVWDGTAIYNALREHPARVVVRIDGLAASMGSYIAMAGDEIRIAKNALMMVHNPRGAVFGGSDQMRQYADMLDKLTASARAVYAERTGKGEDEWAKMMDAETWFSAEEAKEAGLVDEVEETTGPTACFDVTQFKNAPPSLRAAWEQHQQSNNGQRTPPRGEPEVSPSQEIPLNLESFKAYAAEHPDAVAAFIEQGKKSGASEARTQETDRLKALVAACPGRPQLAISYFLAGQDADAVKLAVEAIDAEAKAKDEQIAALKAQAEKAAVVAGTQGAIGTAGAAVDAAKADEKKGPGARPDGSDPNALRTWAKAQAEHEWDTNAKHPTASGIQDKARYVGFRTAMEVGNLRTVAQKQDAAA